MILNLARFVEAERPFWSELDRLLAELERRGDGRLSVAEAERLHYLHRRAASDLARITTFSGEEELRREVEALVARAHAEVHAAAGAPEGGFSIWRWFAVTFPATFRAHAGWFGLACALLGVGALFGAGVILLDPDSKEALMPFPHLQGDPSERVAEEESRASRVIGSEARFSGMLMTHNTRVAILALALGVTYGVGTSILLFSNGAMLGAVCADYIRAGEGVFLTAWLLPHGSVEIPAILIAGQAGLLLAATLIGGAGRKRLGERLRERAGDLVTLIAGVALLLVWAGLVEAFLSQFHEPAVPYWAKIVFGALSLGGLAAYLGLAGRSGGRAP